ncbi:MAG: response regulator [Blastocatellia bacterium]|nr:response regulator [Blastocatellia bacterium]HMZ81535.1 response regulator [Acidobacteriota bacterium]
MPKDVHILLIEDNLGDVRLIQETFREAQVKGQIEYVTDGLKASAYLYQEPPYQHAVRPDLILLDLNLPRKDGRELLVKIKQNDNLKQIPVLVLSTSEDEADIWKSYEAHANCYLKKPMNFDEFYRLIQAIEMFWLQKAKLPPQQNPSTLTMGTH